MIIVSLIVIFIFLFQNFSIIFFDEFSKNVFGKKYFEINENYIYFHVSVWVSMCNFEKKIIFEASHWTIIIYQIEDDYP